MAATHASPTGMWVSKLSLRVCSILFSVAVIGISAFYAKTWTLGPIITTAPPAFVAILWDCVESLVLCIRRGHRGFPYACIVLDLLLLLGFGAVSVLTGVITSKLSDSGYYIAYYQDEIGSEYLRVALAFSILATVVHIALFAMACYEVKNKGATRVEPQPQVIYVQTGPNGEILSEIPMSQMHQQQNGHPNLEPPPVYSPAEVTPFLEPEHPVEGTKQHFKEAQMDEIPQK